VGHPTPVGLYPLGNSTEGLSDLLGNVWEWTSDWFDEGYYRQSPASDPKGPDNALQYKVVRGGAWAHNPQNARVSLRNWSEPTLRLSVIGFRCAGELS